MAVSNSYINKIEIGGKTYDIGMNNAIHYHGAVTIPAEAEGEFSEFYSDADCTKKLKRSEYAAAEKVYSKGATLADPSISEIIKGCMVSIGTSEYIVTDINGTAEAEINTWTQMGNVESKTGTVITAASATKGSYVTGVGEVGKFTAVGGVSTSGAKVATGVSVTPKNVTVVTATIGSDNVTPLTNAFVTSVSTDRKTYVTGATITDGSITTASTTTAISEISNGYLIKSSVVTQIPVVTSVDHINVTTTPAKVMNGLSGGVVTNTPGVINIPKIGDTASALTAATVTGVSDVKVVTSVAGTFATSVSTGIMVECVDNTLKFNFQAVPTSLNSGSLTYEGYELGKNIGLDTSSDTFAQNLTTGTDYTVITAVGQSEFVPSYATVIDSVSEGGVTVNTANVVENYELVNPRLTDNYKTVTAINGITYTAPVLTAPTDTIDYVKSAADATLSVVTSAESINIITSVPVGTQSVVTAVSVEEGDKIEVVTGVEATGKTEVISAISLSSADAIATFDSASGTVVTAVF